MEKINPSELITQADTLSPEPEQPDTESPKPPEQPEKPERPGYDFLICGDKAEKFEKGQKIIYKSKKTNSGTIKDFIRDENGNITGVEIRGKGLKTSRKITKEEFIEWQGLGETGAETVVIDQTESDTVIAKTESKKSGVEEQQLEKKIEAGDTSKILSDLNEEKKKIEAQLSAETDENTKKELLKKKRAVCEAIIEVASGRDGKDIKKEIKEEEQGQFEINLASMGKTEESYKKDIRDRYYNEIISKSNLTEKQKKILIKEGEIDFGAWLPPRKPILEKEDVATFIMARMNPAKIRYAGLFGSSKTIKGIFIKNEAGKEEEMEAENIDEFNKYLKSTTGRAVMEEEIRQRIEQSKREIIDKRIADFVLNEKIAEIIDSLEEEEANKKWESSVPEFSEKSEGNEIVITDKEITDVENNKISKNNREFIDELLKKSGEEFLDLSKEENKWNALLLLQEEEEKFRSHAEKIDKKISKKPGMAGRGLESLSPIEKTRIEEKLGREEHKKLANALVELASFVSGKDIYVEAEKAYFDAANKGEIQPDVSNKNREIGNIMYKLIKKMIENHRLGQHLEFAEEPDDSRDLVIGEGEAEKNKIELVNPGEKDVRNIKFKVSRGSENSDQIPPKQNQVLTPESAEPAVDNPKEELDRLKVREFSLTPPESEDDKPIFLESPAIIQKIPTVPVPEREKNKRKWWQIW